MAKKNVSTLVSALGVLMSIITALVSAVRKQGGTDEDIHRLATPEGESLIEKIAELIVNAGKPIEQLAENCYRVVVDYGRSLAQMIAAGNYDWANKDINVDHFPIQGSGQQNVVVELVHFGRDMASDEVLKEFAARGLRAATLPELLAFGATCPEKQREFELELVIVCVDPGSVWQDHRDLRHVPYLCTRRSERELRLYWGGGRWGDGCRFAAVRLPAGQAGK